ncbi:protein SON isoform X2 [Varanus komodoensis]|uniref:protein SON isoform X2 n=1 Tax=Varanus komodoensis TaxID=61221 RepID=UPI001CF7C500|nr:protein SON isoform X2 [Varanus komodoensis]XP_044298024.1 protein SON isoform X2 [Varanus komodoensis]XP_044298025.1 protein SON isoform X2 [Varanus komodoensis]
MATNIEQIFRSFVVSKFREIQEQQFGGGKVGAQHNGEINSSEQVNPSDDTIASIGNLQNDPLVQKIEQVLSEVLGAESQYRSDDQEDLVKNKSRSYKRGLSEEVQDEIPRKKSKKDKKHKDKKKKKKRKKEKKEKKYKRQSKGSKVNAQEDECEELSPCSHSKPENSSSLMSTEDVDIQSASALTQGSSWIKEKSALESLNSTTSNSHDAFSSDTSKLDTSEDDSALIRGQEIRKVDLTNERELQNDSYQTTNLTVNLFTEIESLNTSEADGSVVCMARSGVSCIKEVEQPEASSVLEATEKVSVPGNSPHSVVVELEDAEMSLESDTMEVKSLDSVSESLYSDSMKQSVTTSFETSGCKFMNAPLEAVAEAKDSVTTLGFLAMVVGKDFEATSEFLNTAKVKAAERSPKHTAITDVKDLVHDTERITAVKDLQKNLQFESRAELKDSEGTPESLHEISGKGIESVVESKLKSQPNDSERITKFDILAETLATETMARKTELKATQGSVIMMESQDSEKYPGPQEIVADAKDLRKPPELEVMSRTNSEVCVSDVVEAKNLDTASACKKIDLRYLKAKSDDCASEMENVNTVPEPLGMMGARTLDCPPGFQKTTQEQKGDSKIIQDSDTVIEVKVHESSSQSKVPEISGLEAISETSEIMKTQNLEFSEYLSRGDMASEKKSDLPEYESSRKNEVLLESQSLSMLQESGTTLRSDTLTLQTMEAHSEMARVSNTENSEVPSQCEELVVVGELEGAPGSRFALGTLTVKTTPLLVHATEDKEFKATKTVGAGANIDKLMVSTESVVLQETFEPVCVMDVKDLEASQKLETDLDSVAQKEISNLHTQSSHKAGVNAAETLKKTGHLVDAYIAEDILTAAEEKDSGPVLESDAKYSESFFESTTISEKDNSDTNLSMFVTDVKDSAAGSSALGTGELNNLKAVLHFERTSTPLCALESRDSNDAVASLPKTEIKDIRKTLNYERVLEVKDPVVCAAHLSTPGVAPSESVSVSEVTDGMGFIELKTTPTDTGDLKSSDTTAETNSLIIDPEIHLQQEHSSIVKCLDSTSEAEYVLETPGNKTAAESECTMEEKISEVICPDSVENLEAIPKHIQETKDLESLSQFVHTVNAKDLEGSLIYEDVLNVSGTTPQISSAVERTDLANSSMVAEAVKESEYPKYPEEMLGNVDVKNAQEKLGFVAIVELKDTEPTLTSETVVECIHSKEPVSFETTKCKSVGEVKVAQTSTDKEPQMDFEETSKSVLNFERRDLERNSTSVLLSEVDTSEVSLESAQVMHVKDSVHECMSAKNIEISEQHSKCLSETEPKVLESAAGCAELTQAKNLELIPPLTEEAKHSGTTLEDSCIAKEKDLNGTPQLSLVEQGIKEAPKPVCPTVKDNFETNQQMTVLKDLEAALEPVHVTAEKSVKVGEQVITETKDSEAALEPMHVEKEKDLETTLQDSVKDHDSEATPKSSDITKENEESALKEKKSEKISSKSRDKSKSGKKAKKSRSKSPSKSKKRKKKSRSHSTSRQAASRRGRSRSKTDSSSRKKHSTSRHKSRSRSADKKESKESSVRSRRRRSRTSDLKSRSRSPEKRETSVRSRQRRSRSSDHHKSRSRSVDRRESARRRRRLSRSSDNHKSRSRSVDRRERVRSRRRQSRSSDRRKSRSRSIDKRETSVRTRRRRSQSSDHYKSRSRSLDRRESSVRTRRRQSRSSDRHKSRSRSVDDRRESSVRTRRRRSRSRDTRKSRSRSVDRRETTVRTRRRRSRSSDNRKSRSRSVDKRESTARIRRRRSRSSDNRRSKSKSVDKRETSVRTRRRRSVSSDRKSRSKSVDKRETSVRAKRKRSKSSDRKSRSRSVENGDASARSKRRRSKSTDHKSRTKSVDKIESSSRSRHRRSKSSDRRMSKSKSRSKSSERKDKDSLDGSRGKHSKYRSKSKSLEKTEGTESLEVPMRNRTKSPEKQKSKSRSRSKSVDKTREKENLRRSRSKGSKSPEPRSRRRRTVSRSRRNRSRSRKRGSRSKSVQRSRTRSRSRSRSCSRRWRRTRSRSLSRQRSLSRERRRRSRRNRSRSTDRRRRRSDSRDSYRISLRLRSRSRTPARLRCSRSTGRRRSASKSPDHRRSRSSSRSPKRLTDLDKAQLLEIAKANAAAMCAKAGVPLLPSLMPVITPEKKEEKVTQKSAKETILELTEKCKKIAQSQEDDVIVNKPHVSDEEEEEHPFINHPFKLNEPKPIFFNLTTPTIKPAPPKTQVTLTKEFPVSSGSQHRKKEADSAYGEWVPVEKNKDENKDDVFPNPANLEPVDISSALNERQIAQKRLTENTFDLEAMCLLNRAQERIDAWAELNSIPGHFTGSTGVQVLSSEQLSNSGPQAWVKKVFSFAPRIGYSWSSHLCGLFL